MLDYRRYLPAACVVLLVLLAAESFVLAQELRTSRGLFDQLQKQSAKPVSQKPTAKQPVSPTPSPEPSPAPSLGDCGSSHGPYSTETFDFSFLTASGFTVLSGCHETETDQVVFILGRPKLIEEGQTLLTDGGEYVIAVAPSPNKRFTMHISKQEFGLFTELGGDYCVIDHVFKNTTGDTDIALRCGSGEAGGISSLKLYNFDKDQLVEVANFNGVIRQDLLKYFRDTSIGT